MPRYIPQWEIDKKIEQYNVWEEESKKHKEEQKKTAKICKKCGEEHHCNAIICGKCFAKEFHIGLENK
jgi:uncharacterized OB-fold protein